ncbi:MAG TPA: spore germination protein [Oscillospiraceae bacterium]|nr:spore germination protein [Oscillospiraceae bacterium]
MGLWEKLFGEEDENTDLGEMKVHKNLDKNFEMIKDLLTDCDDILFREIEIGADKGCRAVVISIDGMADKEILNDYTLKNLMVNSRIAPPDIGHLKKQISSIVKNKTLSAAEMKEVETIEQAVVDILSGDTAVILDNYDKIIVIGTKGWQIRNVSEPETENVVRGPREGFIETMRINTAMVRRRIRDHKFKIKQYQIGKRSKTDVGVMYIEDLVDESVLIELDKRLRAIDIDAILDSGYIEQLIEDNWRSPFPQIQNTERPDVATAALYEGKVSILVDNSPFALIIPSGFNAMMQSAEDYYERWGIATFVRFLRYTSLLVSLYAPALYIAVTAFHPQMLPAKLLISIATDRSGVPFPAVLEAIIMEVTLEILREAGVRLPAPIGTTIGIVGAIVIGQAAVDAGIVGSVMVVIVAITAISSFATPSYNLGIAIRLLRFGLIIASAVLGLYGIMIVTILILIHLCGLKSFGVPYLTPYAECIKQCSDLKDSFFKVPLPAMHYRETTVKKPERRRMKDYRDEDFNNEG